MLFRRFQPRQPYAVDAFASTGVGFLLSRIPAPAGDARRRAMGGAMAAARVRPTRPLRSTGGPGRPAPRRAARIPSVPVSQFAKSPPAPRRGPARPTRFQIVRWSADSRADSPRVMPETRCVSKKWGWWPGAESNHRHADFQSAALPREIRWFTASRFPKVA